MGLPQIAISFKAKGTSAIRRSQKGVACLLFKRAEGEDLIKEYKSFSEIDSSIHSENELTALERCFNEGVRKIICVCVNDTANAENALRGVSFNWLGVCDEAFEGGFLKNYVANQRKKGNYVKAVVPYEYDFNDPAFVVPAKAMVKFAGDENTYTQAELVPSLVGMLCYLPLGESITYRRMADIVEYSAENDEDSEVDRGRIVLVRDSEGYKIGRGVNNLVSGAASDDMKKIRIMESMDTILTDIKASLEEGYIGKVKNDYDSKLLLCIAISGYFEGLGESVLDKSYENKVGISLDGQRSYLIAHGIDTQDMSDMEILKANTGSYVYLEGNIRFVDAMEDIVFGIEM